MIWLFLSSLLFWLLPVRWCSLSAGRQHVQLGRRPALGEQLVRATCVMLAMRRDVAAPVRMRRCHQGIYQSRLQHANTAATALTTGILGVQPNKGKL